MDRPKLPDRYRPIDPLWVELGMEVYILTYFPAGTMVATQGRVATYGQVAEAVGRPAAVRAVGAAVGANPVSLLIPCHRVILASGVAHAYRWGVERKRALLALEAART